jgi:transcriptional regulator with XRE-family HTH domain
MAAAAPAAAPSLDIRAARLSARLTLRELGVLSGISYTAIWAIEHGRQPNARERESLAAALLAALAQQR